MNLRALIFDDDSAIRKVLWMFFDSRGYEVFTFPNPALCPLAEETVCPCPEDQSCTDVIISDIKMPLLNGLDFIAEQIEKGCKCKNIALMSGRFTMADFAKAKTLGLTLFPKPFSLAEIRKWLVDIETDIDPSRKLADWYINRIQTSKGEPQ